MAWQHNGTSWQPQGRGKQLFHTYHRRTELSSHLTVTWIVQSWDKGLIIASGAPCGFLHETQRTEKRHCVNYWLSCLEFMFNNPSSPNVKLQGKYYLLLNNDFSSSKDNIIKSLPPSTEKEKVLKNSLTDKWMSMEREFWESISSLLLVFLPSSLNIALLVAPVLSLTVPWEYWVVHLNAAFGRQSGEGSLALFEISSFSSK